MDSGLKDRLGPDGPGSRVSHLYPAATHRRVFRKGRMCDYTCLLGGPSLLWDWWHLLFLTLSLPQL